MNQKINNSKVIYKLLKMNSSKTDQFRIGKQMIQSYFLINFKQTFK